MHRVTSFKLNNTSGAANLIKYIKMGNLFDKNQIKQNIMHLIFTTKYFHLLYSCVHSFVSILTIN